MPRLLLSLLTALAVLPSMALRPSVEAFCRAPIDVVDYLPEYSRLDMVDYFDSGSTVASDSYLGNKIHITALDSMMVRYAVDDSVKVTLALLPAGRDTLMMVIKELPAPVFDSTVSFYDGGWQPVASPPLNPPRFSNWLKDSKRAAAVAFDIPFVMATADFDPATGRLVYMNQTERYFDERERPDALSELRRTLEYQWNGRRFVAVKQQ